MVVGHLPLILEQALMYNFATPIQHNTGSFIWWIKKRRERKVNNK